MKEKILTPRAAGLLREEETPSSMRLLFGKGGTSNEGASLLFSILVDELDGVIADCRFQVYGPSLLIGIAEIVATLILRKNYDQAMKIEPHWVEKELLSKKQKPFCDKERDWIALALDALKEGLSKCSDIPLSLSYLPSPIPSKEDETGEEGAQEEYPGWVLLPIDEKKKILNSVIEKEVRPYVELDAGGVAVIEVKGEFEVVIAYEGACTSCYSAIGGTLQAIQEILRRSIHPKLKVVPDLSLFTDEGIKSAFEKEGDSPPR